MPLHRYIMPARSLGAFYIDPVSHERLHASGLLTQAEVRTSGRHERLVGAATSHVGIGFRCAGSPAYLIGQADGTWTATEALLGAIIDASSITRNVCTIRIVT